MKKLEPQQIPSVAAPEDLPFEGPHGYLGRVSLSRRQVLLAGLGGAILPFFSACKSDNPRSPQLGLVGVAPESGTESLIGFQSIQTSTADLVTVAPGYRVTPIIPWGDPIRLHAPAFMPDASDSASAQAQQIGDNHDGMAFFGFDPHGRAFGDRSDEGLLAVNHEYINPEYLYAPGSDPTDWLLPFTAERALKAQAAHGCSIVHLRRNHGGDMAHDLASSFNRRIHANTPMLLQGPAAGHPLLKTAADPSGTQVLGMLGNCGNGQTPWGTYLSCEENVTDYFGWNGARNPSALERRYGLSAQGLGYRWHTVDPRFDLNANPNEPNRFGWVVEIDPFDPDSVPIKRTALGRFKHENAGLTIAPNGQVVVYMGDDERNEYIYKFVSQHRFDAANPGSDSNRTLLEAGTLYVARFDSGAEIGDRRGSGIWIPLVHGQYGLTEANGFGSQGEVLIRARQAADRVGATMMDRPEWIAVNPKQPGQVFATLTNNDRRGGNTSNAADGTTPAASAEPPIDDANPRAQNVWGHIIRWQEAGGDPTALSFTWDLFVLAGQASPDASRAASANIDASNLFNSPDSLAFDPAGRLWILTDGKCTNQGDFAGMGNNQMFAADPNTGEIRRFLVGPSGCELTGLALTPDGRTLFVNVQHPGEIGNHPRTPRHADGSLFSRNDIARAPKRFSTWPSGNMRPRSATLVIRRVDGGLIGT